MSPVRTSERRRQQWRATSAKVSSETSSSSCALICDLGSGRKLRCSGERPKCSNCGQRDGQQCVYADAPRRRGPGKANKIKLKASGGPKSQPRSSGSLLGGQFPPVSDSFDTDPFNPYRQSTSSQLGNLGALETSSISTATPPPHTPTTDDATRPASPNEFFIQGPIAQSIRRQLPPKSEDSFYAPRRQQPKREDGAGD